MKKKHNPGGYFLNYGLLLLIIHIHLTNAKKQKKQLRSTFCFEIISDNWEPFKNDEECFLFHVKGPSIKNVRIKEGGKGEGGGG